MADILVRGLDAKVLKRLKDRAKRNGRSLQCEVKLALENAAGPTMSVFLDSARAVRESLGRKFDNSADLIREDRVR